MVVDVNLALTYAIAHALEDNAKVYAIAKQLSNPVLLPHEEVSKLHDFWIKNYGQKALEWC